MADFGDKYDGDVQAALRGLQKERLAVDVAPIDRNAMKRKWAVAPEEEPETRQGDSKSDNHRRATKTREFAHVIRPPFQLTSSPPSTTKKSSHCTSIAPKETASSLCKCCSLPHLCSKDARRRTSFFSLPLSILYLGAFWSLFRNKKNSLAPTRDFLASPPHRQARVNWPAYPQPHSFALRQDQQP